VRRFGVKRIVGASARLDEAARIWVLQHWRYVPARRGGKPVSSTADASVVFNLKERPN